MVIKHNAEKDINLFQTLQHLRFQDGTFEAGGLDAVKACMKKGLRAKWKDPKGQVETTGANYVSQDERAPGVVL